MMKQIAREEALGSLKGITQFYFRERAMKELANNVLYDAAFAEAPGSSRFHHAYRGGLAHHTAEVVSNCIHLAGELPHVDTDVLLMAAIFHDWMKTREYVLEEDGSVTKTPYCYLIGHVVGSAMAFRELATTYLGVGVSVEFIDDVTHVMLAHHGRTEWRSPVEPQTPEAWILHAADMLSARPLGNPGGK